MTLLVPMFRRGGGEERRWTGGSGRRVDGARAGAAGSLRPLARFSEAFPLLVSVGLVAACASRSGPGGGLPGPSATEGPASTYGEGATHALTNVPPPPMPAVERVSLAVPVLTVDGEGIDLDEVLPGPVLLWYFSASCPHCQAAIPEVIALAPRLSAFGIAVVGIASSTNRLGEVREFQERYQVPFPIYHDFTRRYANGNLMESTPTALLVDESGRVEAEYRPYHPGSALAVEMGVLARRGHDPFRAFEPGRYYGTRACADCHAVEYRSWALTHHSIAYQTVYSREKHLDPACVGCHVTGWRQPTGYTDLDATPGLTDVGCESCHGPGGVHGARLSPDGDRWKPPFDYAPVCAGCHDAKHSVAFDLGRALPHIDHFTAARLGDDEFGRRLDDLASGRAERPMLAFPEGKNLGDGACRDCHAEEHAGWAASPHGKAIESLVRNGAHKEPSCLACHALPMVKPAARAADFRPGVSCEQCHGPGERHVAAAGAPGTILGLGESCPVCVIEELCARCHTPEMDADFDLDLALPKVRHRPAAAGYNPAANPPEAPR